MKILIYQPRVSYYTGGGEVYPLQTAKFFAKLGHDVTILTTKADYIKFSDYFLNFVDDNPNVKIEYLELDNNYKFIYDIPAGMNWERWDLESLYVARPAYNFLTNHKYDIVACHCVIDTLAVPFDQKHVLHLHGSPTELNYVCKLILQKEKNIIAVSNDVATKWKDLGVYSKMRICTNAIDDTIFVPTNNKRNNDLLFVGRLIEIKGISYILEAISTLKLKYNLILYLQIIGDGPLKNQLKEQVKDLDIEKQVIFNGLVSNEFLLKSYQNSKIAVLPSYQKEGILSTLLEAAACATPSITTKGTSMEEFAKNNQNALLVNPKDSLDLAEKIFQLYTDNKLYTKIQKNAYNEVKTNYVWLEKAKELINLYSEDKYD